MIHRTAARRLAPGKRACGIAAATATALVLAPGAGGKVFFPTPGAKPSTDATSLQAAVVAANASTDPVNQIVLQAGAYTPTDQIPPITKNLVIVADHTIQDNVGTLGSPRIVGLNQPTTVTNLLTVGCATGVPGCTTTVTGVGLTLDGVVVTGGGPSPTGSGVLVNTGNSLTTWGAAISGNQQNNLTLNAGSQATLNETTVDDASAGFGIQEVNATLTMKHVTIAYNPGGGLSNSGGTVTSNDTVYFQNINNSVFPPSGVDCAGAVNSADHSIDDDGTCLTGVAGTNLPNNTALNLSASANSGGPTPAITPGAGSSAINFETNTANCTPTDQKFFVHSTAGCDSGAVQSNGARLMQTSPPSIPSCTVSTDLVSVPNTQTVTVTDNQAGLGPQAGNTIQTPVPPSPFLTDQQPAGTGNPEDAITNLQIVGGSVAFTPFLSPAKGSLALKATRATGVVTGGTTWSFTVTDWAGLRRDLNSCP
jgi:hypothetical protein